MTRLGRASILTLGLALGACGGSTSGGSGTGGSGAVGGSAFGGFGGTVSGGGTAGTGAVAGGGTGGIGGTGGTTPAPKVGKLDLLLMVDNSLNMGEPQQLLADAVPYLVEALISPPDDPSTGKPAYAPLTDIHIGIVSSSLGSHGGNACAASSPSYDPMKDDHGRLLPSVRAGLTSYQNLGFLWWDPSGKAQPPGESNSLDLTSQFAITVSAAGEKGCGYEAQLESWYRFLVDPNPPGDVVVQNNVATITGTDDVVLQQRSDFLRPDSAVVILMLSDENDCSIIDGGFNWIAAQIYNPNNTPYHLPAATSACKTNPDDPCCQSCAEAAANPGCPPLGGDPNCQAGPLTDASDHPNLRCFQQKKRFGINFLYPTARYVEGLTQAQIHTQWDGEGPVAGSATTQNPLFAGGRHPGLVFLGGIVGVPWQDIASDASLSDPNALDYLSADELGAKGRWQWLLPDSATDDPDDPLMIESTTPRSGTNPATGSALAPPSAAPNANPVNGHEWTPNNDDLEYACVYPLLSPKDCNTATGSCMCYGGSTTSHEPVCQDPATGQYGSTQYMARALPGTRELTVLRDVGSQAVVASICPKETKGGTAIYGYMPAVKALSKRLGSVLLPP